MALMRTSTDVNPNSETHFSIKVEPDQESNLVLANLDLKGSSCKIECDGTSSEKEAPLTDQTKTQESNDDLDVDIIKSSDVDKSRLPEAEDPNATEYSSSFGNSESDNERCSGMSEAEVESKYFGDCPNIGYDPFGSLLHMRKRRLTTHWRSFIRPLMWRCKWTELRIKEIDSQALKYSRELEAYSQKKHGKINQSSFEALGSKSCPFSSQSYRKKVMKRRKRKRVEDTTDIASYMSQHNLFSYLESKKSNPDGNSGNEDFSNAALLDLQTEYNDGYGGIDLLSYDSRDGDNLLEKVLWKIDLLSSKVHKLKNQLDVVLSKNASKFSSSENLSLLAPCDGQASSVPSGTFSAGNGDTISVGATYNPAQHISEYDLGDLVIPGPIHVPDIIESTVGLLSAAEVTFHQPHIGDSCEDILDNILIQNDGGGEMQQTFIGTSNQSSLEKHPELGKGEVGESTGPAQIPSTTEAENMGKSTVSQEQSSLKSSCLASELNVPMNKRKRGERKAGPGCWSKKGTGEPDSQ